MKCCKERHAIDYEKPNSFFDQFMEEYYLVSVQEECRTEEEGPQCAGQDYNEEEEICCKRPVEHGLFQEYLMDAKRGCLGYCGRIEYMPQWQVCCEVNGNQELFGLREGCPEKEPEKEFCDRIPYDPRRLQCCKVEIEKPVEDDNMVDNMTDEMMDFEKPSFDFGGLADLWNGGSQSILYPVDEPCPGSDVEPVTEDPITEDPMTSEAPTTEPKETEPVELDCLPGQAYDFELAKCMRCLAGSFSVEGKKCEWCPAGMYQENNGRDHCKECLGNSVSQIGATRCEDPEPTEKPTEKPETENPVTEKPETETPETENPTTGRPVTERPETEEPCFPGSGPNSNGECQRCDAGHYSGDGVRCAVCEENTFQPLVGQTRCMPCLDPLPFAVEGSISCTATEGGDGGVIDSLE